MYREEQSHTQPHFHANPRLTRRISPLFCSTTMQGPSHAPKQSNHRFCPHGKSIARRASIQPCCQPGNASPTSPATKGYIGLRNSPAPPPRCNKMHQNAQDSALCMVPSRHQLLARKGELQNKLPSPTLRHHPITSARGVTFTTDRTPLPRDGKGQTETGQWLRSHI